jgi:hypothetical protein
LSASNGLAQKAGNFIVWQQMMIAILSIKNCNSNRHEWGENMLPAIPVAEICAAQGSNAQAVLAAIRYTGATAKKHNSGT